ncbi:hypothetical protein ACSQ67_004732 [Phaseolus vulgaris]
MDAKSLGFGVSVSHLLGYKSPPNTCLFTIRCFASNGERPWKTSDVRLVLEDRSIWKARLLGASGTQMGEVVFNTLLTGYQEILTDPSYAGQFVLMTNPHISNTGVNFGKYLNSKSLESLFLEVV